MKEEKEAIILAVDKGLKDELLNEAKQKGLSLSSLVRMILIEHANNE